jgi:hypothetical protein
MEVWKKIILWSVGIGAGFAITASLVVGGFIWWSSRPTKPKPWNQTAITAKYDSVDVDVKDQHIYFVYILENHTDSDFTLENNSGVHLGASLKRSSSISFSDSEYLTADYPIYVPAKHSVRIKLHIKYPYKIPFNYEASDDEKHDWETKLTVFLVKELSNLNGFVLMDENSRYQIDFPSGWRDRANEPMRIKDTAK